MSKAYLRVKKWHALNKVIINRNFSSINEQSAISDQHICCASNDSNNSQVYKNDFNISDISESVMNNFQVMPLMNRIMNGYIEKNINRKTPHLGRSWALCNINILTLNVVTQLLQILREKGHEDLPKTSQQLLNTKHCRPMTTVLSKRETNGNYIYIGIKNVLKKVIYPDIYKEEILSVQIHIDGISIYNNSLIQV